MEATEEGEGRRAAEDLAHQAAAGRAARVLAGVAVAWVDAPWVGTPRPQVLVAPEVVGPVVLVVPPGEVAATAPRVSAGQVVAEPPSGLAVGLPLVGVTNPASAVPDVAVDAAVPKAVVVGGVASEVIDVGSGPAAVAGAIDLDGTVVRADHAVAYVARPPIHAVVNASGVPAEVVPACPAGASTEVGLVDPVEVLPIDVVALGVCPVVAAAARRAADRAAAAA